MKTVLSFSLFFLLLSFSLSAQQNKYILQVEINHFEKSAKPSFFVMSVGHKFILKKITKPQFQIVVDSIISYPQSVGIGFYPDCNEQEIKDLTSLGVAYMHCPSTNFFITGAKNSLLVKKDTILLLEPSLLQKEYQQIDDEIMARVDVFNQNIGNRLHAEFNVAKTQKEKDSLEQLNDNIFKANVGKPNLDSVLIPAIENNIDNGISLYAMNKYIFMARVFQMEIPAATFQSALQSMPEKQKQYEIWKELNKIVKDIAPNKELIGKVAPEFVNLKDTSGNFIYLKDLKGKVVFIDFWASWCGPCRKQLPMLKSIYQSVKNKNIAFVSISIDDNIHSWKREIIASQINWINVSDLKANNGKTSVDYNVLTVPHNFLINKEGIVVGKDVPLDKLKMKIEKLL